MYVKFLITILQCTCSPALRLLQSVLLIPHSDLRMKAWDAYAANIIVLYFMDTVFILPHRALQSSITLPLNARVRFEIL